MHKNRLLTIILIQTFLVASLIQFNCSKDKLCCLQYETNSDKVKYCNNHRDAVGKFIREIENKSEQKTRLNKFKHFYESIKDCTILSCIEQKIDTDRSIPAFKSRYYDEHEYAEANFVIDSTLKVPLILCGFKHAIDALEQTSNNKNN
jgi:hypothetical protein